MSRRVIMIAALVVIAGYFYFKSTDKSQEMMSSQTNQVEAPSTAEDGSTMTEDQLLVENLIKDGTIERIDEESNPPKVYVTAHFYTAPNVDKQAILEVLLKDFKADNPAVSSFYIYDSKSGDEVGIYDSEGLKTK